MPRPDIVLILIDDLGWRDLVCYGSTFYETPHLDRLAAGGMRFTDGYASCPVCSPTRASLMTGKYPATVGMTNWIPGNPWGRLMGVPYFHELPREEITLADALRAGGYRTLHVGKWHMGEEGNWPQDRGFEVNVGGCDWGAPHRGYFSPYHIPQLEDGPEGEYLTDRLTDEAIRLLNEPRDRPVFLNLCHYAVHTPIQAPAALIEKYKRKAHDMGLDTQPTFEDGAHFPCLHKKDQRIRRRLLQSDPAYAAMMENLDTNIGRLLDAIAASGRADNTIVIFTSDNGGLTSAETSPTCNRPLCEGKGWMADGGLRVPLLVRWPGVVKGGTTCEVPVTSTDFFPTLLEAAGLPPMPEQHVDGESIVPLLRGEGALRRDAIYWHYPHYSNQGDTPSCAVRCGDWKLIEHFEDHRLQLYNLRDDIREDHDRSADRPDLVSELHAKLVAWRTASGAKVPQVNEHYDDMFAGRRPSPDGFGNFPPVPGDDH